MHLRNRIPIIAAVAVAASAVLALPAAASHGRPLYGDVDGDGRIDEVVLGKTAAACATTVRLGQPGGGYGAPVTRTYALPPQGYFYCPDMGVVVDLGSDGAIELVLTFFDGTNGGEELLVLRDWTVAGGFRGQWQPSRIGTEDFNGDGRMDVWELTDQGDGFSTFLNTADGRLTPGSPSFGSVDLFEVEFADFDQDGATDVLAHNGYFEDETIDVLVAYGDGRIVELHNSDDDIAAEDATVIDANGDRFPDVRVFVDDDSEQIHTGNGDGTFWLSSFGSPAVTVTGVLPGTTYGDSAVLQPARPADATATLDEQPIGTGASIPLHTLALGEHRLVVTAGTGEDARTRTVLFRTGTSFTDVAALVDLFRAQGHVSATTAAGLHDRLARAEAKAAAGHELAAMGYLDQFIARAVNQIKGDASDLAARDVLVRDARALFAELERQQEAETEG